MLVPVMPKQLRVEAQEAITLEEEVSDISHPLPAAKASTMVPFWLRSFRASRKLSMV